MLASFKSLFPELVELCFQTRNAAFVRSMYPPALIWGSLGHDDSEEKQDTSEAEVVWQTNYREPRQKC